MNLIRACRGQLILTLLLLAAILVMPFQDYTERRLTAEDMNYPEASIGVVSEDGGILSIPGGAGHLVLSSDEYYLKKGTYEVTFSTVSDEEENTVEVFEPLYLNSDNTSGRILAQTQIDPEENLTTLSFTIEDYVSCVQFRVETDSALEFQGIYLLSEMGLYKDPYIYAGLLLLGSLLLLLYRKHRKIRPEILLALSFAALWSSAPLCLPGLLNGHDMYFHYGRLFALSQDLSAGSFPVRIHSEMFRSFGYMSPVFYAETFLYPFALLIRLGLSPVGCYRFLLLCISFATAGISYYAFSRLCRSRRLGLATAFLYTLSSYRLINLYTRAAIGEVLAAVFLPLLLLGMYQLFYGNSRKWVTAVLAFTALFQSHMITTELALGFSVLFGLISIRRLKDRTRLLHLFIAGGATILLNLWSILPFLTMLQYPLALLGDTRNLAGYSLYGMQVFDTGLLNPAGDALGRGSISGEMPYSIGLLLLAGSLLFVVLCFRRNQKLSVWHRSLGSWCLAFGILSVYASTIWFPWETLQRIEIINRIAGAIQFSSRFLPMATLFLSVVSAIAFYHCFHERTARQLLFLGCAFFLTWSAGNYFSSYANEAESFVSWNDQMDHVMDCDALYLVTDNGKYFSVRRMRAQNVSFTASQGVALHDVSKTGTQAAFTYEKEAGLADSWVEVSLNYYPQYEAIDQDGNKLATEAGDLLRLRVLLPEDSSGTVHIQLRTPAFWRAGDIISLAVGLGLVSLAILTPYKKKKGE